MQKQIIFKKILISLIILFVLFNHSSSIIEFITVSNAEEIEIEELDEEINKSGRSRDVNDDYENLLLEPKVDRTYKNSSLYDNSIIGEVHTSPEIDNEKGLEDTEIGVEMKINKKVALEDGLYIEELVKVSIKRNGVNINSAIITFDNLKFDDVDPVYYGIIGKTNISNSNRIKILEDQIDNSYDDIYFEYKLELIYPKEISSFDENNLVGSIILENGDENLKRDYEAYDKNEDEVEYDNSNLEVLFKDENLYKSYMRASAISSNRYDTEYNQEIQVDTFNNGLDVWYEVDTGVDEFETAETNIILEDEIKFVRTEISKDNFSEVLGDDGFIEIYYKDQIVGVIESSTKIEEDKYIFDYEVDYDKLTFKIYGANAGKLKIHNKKAFIGTDNYSNGMISRINGIKSIVKERAIVSFEQNDFVINSQEKDAIITLHETISKAELDIDNTVFSTNLDNEVRFDITLDTSDIKYEPFKNPSFEIALPSMISDVEIENVNLFNKNGLSLDTWNVITKENGNKVIKIDLKGGQEEYKPGQSLPGTKIIVETKLKVNDLTPTGATSVKLTYNNGTKTQTEYEVAGETSYSCDASYYSNVGIISLTQLENYNNKGDKLYHLQKDTTIGMLDTYGDEKNASVDITLLNNYNSDIKNVVIIGRIPAIGMVNSNNELMNATFDTKLNNLINTSGLLSKVYYSNKLDCGIDDESWVENVDNISEVKSYKIVIDEGVISHGELEKISYQLKIPKKLGTNQKAFNICTIYYEYENQNCKDESIIELQTNAENISIDDFSNIVAVDDYNNRLNVGAKATAAGVDLLEGDIVHYGQMIRYTYVISNNSNEIIKNIKLEGTAHNANMYYRAIFDNISSSDGSDAPIYQDLEDTEGTHNKYEETINELKPGESKIISYQVFARGNRQESDNHVYGQLKVTAEGINKEIQTISNTIKDSELELEIIPGVSESVNYDKIPSNNNYDFFIKVRNNTASELDNVVVKVEMPKLLTLNELKSYAVLTFLSGYEENDIRNVAQFTINHIPSGQDYYLTLPVYIGGIDLNKENEEFSILAKVNYNNELYYSNDYTRVVEQIITKYDGNVTANPKNESVVKDGDQVEYTVRIQNTGVAQGMMEASTLIPSGIDVESLTYTYGDGTKTYYDANTEVKPSDNNTELFVLKPGEKAYINIKGIVNKLDLGTEQDKIVFTPKTDYFDFNTITYFVDTKDVIHANWNKDAVDIVAVNNPSQKPTEVKENEELIEEVKQDNQNTNQPDNVPIKEQSPEKAPTDTSASIKENNDNIIEENSFTKQVRDYNEINGTQFENGKGIEDNYSISGSVWLDSNRDGIYSAEDGISNISVYLYKDEIKNSSTKKEVKTNENGEYTFEKLEQGEYYVVFEYDNDNYSITKYNATADDSKVSNCTQVALDINDNVQFYGVSEKINVSNSINNINLGLTPKNNFDLSISSYIESVSIKYNDGYIDNSYSSDNSLPKIELNRKKANEAIVSIKLRINVENKGNIPGYIIQLKDKLPEGFKLDDKQNLNWSLGNDGYAYFSGLSKERLNPTDNRVIYLILYKEVGDTVLGTFKNEVSIEETSNDELVNEAHLEDNIDSQEFILSISTGVITYILLVFLIIIVLLLVVMLISNKIIPDTKHKQTIIKIAILVFILLTIIIMLVNTYADENSITDHIGIIAGILDNTYTDYNTFEGLYSELGIYPNTKKKYYTNKTGDDSTRFQCMEGLDVVSQNNEQNPSIYGQFDTNNSGRGIGSIFKINSLNDEYLTKAINQSTYTGNTNSDKFKYAASRLALMGVMSEEGYANALTNMQRKSSFSYFVYHAVTLNSNNISNNKRINDFTKMIGYSYSMDIAKTYYNNSNFNGGYAKMSAKLKDYKELCTSEGHSETVKKVDESNTDVLFDNNGKIGPFYVTAPVVSQYGYVTTFGDNTFNIGNKYIDSKLYFEYYDESNSSWNGLECNIYYDNNRVCETNTDGNIVHVEKVFYDISNKLLYIEPKSTLDYSQVTKFRIRNTHNDFQSMGISFFGNTIYTDKTTFQDIIILRGKKVPNESMVEWNVGTYNVGINKYLDTIYKTENNNIGNTKIVTLNRATLEEDAKIASPYAVDAEDSLIYGIDIMNYGSNLSSITIEDVTSDGLSAVDYSTTNDGTINHGDWTVDGNKYTYNGNVTIGNKLTLYIIMRPSNSKLSRENTNLSNTAKVLKVYSSGNDVTDKLADSSKTESSEHIVLKTYYYDIDKSIIRINNRDVDIKNCTAEPGDIIVVKTTMNNTPNDSNKKYGTLYNIRYSDETNITNGVTLADYVELKGFSETTSNYSTNLNSANVVVSKVNDNNYNISYKKGLNPGASHSIYIAYEVKSTIKDINLVVNNIANLNRIENRNGVNLLSSDVNAIDKTDSVGFRIKNYAFSFSNTITKIEAVRENSITNKAICEYGDHITFRVSIKNEGNDVNNNGTLKKIVLEDVIDSTVFRFIKSTSSTNDLTYSNNKITYLSNSGLGINQEEYIDIEVEVNYKSKNSNVLKNKVKLQEILNINDYVIFNSENNVLGITETEDEESIVYQVYNMGVNQFITKVNGIDVNEVRKDKSEEDRLIAPVEVERDDVVTYNIELSNSSNIISENNNTKLYDITMEDNAENGINFIKDSISIKNGENELNANDYELLLNDGTNLFTIRMKKALDPNEVIYITIDGIVSKANLYLYNLENIVNITNVNNRNNKNIIAEDLINNTETKTKDYIRLKNVVVSGKAWDDSNGDGLFNGLETGTEGIEVRLVDITNKKYISTYTASNGSYSFNTPGAKGYKINYNSNNGTYTTTEVEDDKMMIDQSGRVIKATGRLETGRETGNYTSESEYIEYYVEFIYSGLDFSSTEYSGKSNINSSDLTIKDDYKIDSNAEAIRIGGSEINTLYETFYCDSATNRNNDNTIDVDYYKNEHKSLMSNIGEGTLHAYSFIGSNGATPFINGNKNIDLLWLKTSAGNYDGDTEYLKYINIGLLRKTADLQLTNDLYSIKTTINGVETEYQYNQGKVEGSEYAGEYRTGGIDNDISYKFNIYNADYFYQHTDYSSEEIRNYKKDTELNIQVTYKISITNVDYGHVGTYAVIKEIADFYDPIFGDNKIGANYVVKVYDENGFLQEKSLPYISTSSNYNISNNSIFEGESEEYEGLNSLYLNCIDEPIVLYEGETKDIYLTLTIDKEDYEVDENTTAKLLKLKDGTIRNIAEINAYSFYDSDGVPSGLHDNDANPGNLGHQNTNGDPVWNDGVLYEDDTYETKLQIKLNGYEDDTDDLDYERQIDGTVWEDSRNGLVASYNNSSDTYKVFSQDGNSIDIDNTDVNKGGVQYIGDGIFDDSTKKLEDAMSLEDGLEDQVIKGVDVHLVETIKIKDENNEVYQYEYDWAGSESKALKKYFESTSSIQKYSSISDDNGKYQIYSMVPGSYKIRFNYGKLDVNGNLSDEAKKYNGQDFKSTLYQGISDDEAHDDEIKNINKEVETIIVLDTSNSMTFYNSYRFANVPNNLHDVQKNITNYIGHYKNGESKCLNPNHYKNGFHIIDQNAELTIDSNNDGIKDTADYDLAFGCIDRLDVAIDSIEDYLDVVYEANENNKVAVVLFGGEYEPDYMDTTQFGTGFGRFTSDKSEIMHSLDVLNTVSTQEDNGKNYLVKANLSWGTHYQKGLQRAIDLFDEVKDDGIEKHVIFMTDGAPYIHKGQYPSGTDFDRLYQEISGIPEADMLKRNLADGGYGADIYSVCIGFNIKGNHDVVDEISSKPLTTYEWIVQNEGGLSEMLQLIARRIAGEKILVNNTISKLINTENVNEARDDELRRLSTMSKTEIQINDNQAIANQDIFDKINEFTEEEQNTIKKKFDDLAGMYADTVQFKIGSELIEVTVEETGEKYYTSKLRYSFEDVEQLYNRESRYKIDGIDFGLVYRPKSEISIRKYIKQLDVVLSTGESLVKFEFDEIYDDKTQTLIGTTLNQEKSIGLDNLLYVPTNVENLLGTLYSTVDMSLLEGSTIKIKYVFSVENYSEIDRISNNLDVLRYELAEIKDGVTTVWNSASEKAYSILKDEYDYHIIDSNTLKYNLGDNPENYNYFAKVNDEGTEGYYGRFVGTTYHEGVIKNDQIAKIKINNILDYVDNDISFVQDENISENQYWSPVSTKYLYDEGLVDKSIFEVDGDTYSIYDKAINSKNARNYYDINTGVSNLLISVDDSINDQSDNVQNKSILRYLLPYSMNEGYTGAEGTTISSGKISIITSITVSSEDDLENMNYQNLGEIVKYTSQTGRTTPTNKDFIGQNSSVNNPDATLRIPTTPEVNVPDQFKNGNSLNRFVEVKSTRELIATVGNQDPSKIARVVESDTDAADPVVFTNPTGLLESQMKTIIILSIIVIIIMIWIYKNRKAIKKAIKHKKVNITFKKYYK